MVKVKKDLTDVVFGRLTVLGQAEDYVSPKGHYEARWLVQCSCGAPIFIVHQGSLKSGNTTSCGCAHKEATSKANKTHGASSTGEYKSWSAMIHRCTKVDNPCYNAYGGRGIAICARWLESFDNFLQDMGPRKEGTSLDRIDVNGDYCKENCKWSSRSEQNYNQRKKKTNTSGRTGVSWNATLEKWTAHATKDGNQMYLGVFNSFEEAVTAREKAELELFGYTKE